MKIPSDSDEANASQAQYDDGNYVTKKYPSDSDE